MFKLHNKRRQGECMATIEQRLAEVEAKQDEVINILKSAGGQLQRIQGERAADWEQKVDAIIEVLVAAAGQLASVKPRGH
jgi:hypothetical protein